MPLELLTVIPVCQAGSAGATAVIDVLEFTVNDVAAVEPNMTAVAPLNPLPVMLTEVPPAVEPESGLTVATVGEGPEACAGGVKLSPATTVAITIRHNTDAVLTTVWQPRELQYERVTRASPDNEP